MMALPASVRIYLCTTPCDRRKSFAGLQALAVNSRALDPFAGHLLVFANFRRDRIKVLYWDLDGFAIWAKRLAAGTYAFPFTQDRPQEISAPELQALLSGIDLTIARRRKRYQRKATVGGSNSF
jgi:transposase